MINRISGDNRGLTLLELLIGVVILAIIVVPLLHTFVTGASTEYKARKYAEATDAAQNLCEQIQAQDMDLILSNSAAIDRGAAFYEISGGSYISAGTKASSKSDFPKTYYIGIPNYTYGSSTFDALITLNVPEDAVNSKEVVVGNQMDALLNMAEKDKPSDAMARVDATALTQLQAECSDLVASSELTAERLTRSITLNVTKIANAAATETYKAEVVFNYTANIDYYDKKGNQKSYYFSYSENSSSSVGSVTPKADGSPVFSVFMFYDAYYKNAHTDENILINNATGSDVNFFIVNTDKSAFTLGYNARIWYKYQKFNGNDPVNRLVFTNLPASTTIYSAWRDAIYKKTLPISQYLAETKALSRKFDVSVQLFSAGSNFTGSPIAGIESTKLSY